MCTPTRFNPLKIPVGAVTVVAPPPRAIAVARPRPNNTPDSIENRRKMRRQQFLMFVRVLIKVIEQSNNYKLKIQAKAMVSECVKRNRMGDPHFCPLQESIELRLRGLVGSEYWHQAQDYMASFHSARQSQQARRSRPQIEAL